jgi:hypothetical protein
MSVKAEFLVEIVGSGLVHVPHGKLGLRTGQSHICTSVLMNMTAQLIQFCPSLQLLQSFFQSIAKKVLNTETNGNHCFNFTEKLSYEV